MRPDGTGKRRLTRDGEIEEVFQWSPDGRLLAYAYYEGAIFTVPAAGGSQRTLTSFATPNTGLAWSPDGRRIAFEQERDSGNDVYVMDANGFHERRLTARYYNYGPAWSPDGRTIVFAFFTRLVGRGRSGIAVVDADGSGRRELTSGNDSFPVWQPSR